MGKSESKPEIFGADEWEQGPPGSLLGRCAMRLKRTSIGDRSFMNDPVVIKYVSPHGHVAYTNGYGSCLRGNDGMLGPDWNDDGWTSVPSELCEEDGVKKYLQRITKEMSQKVSDTRKKNETEEPVKSPETTGSISDDTKEIPPQSNVENTYTFGQ